MRSNRVFSTLGLAQKAGKVAGGEFLTEKAVREGKAHLVVLGVDASANTKKKFHDACVFYKVPCLEYGTKEALGRATGKEVRASLAVTDAGFAQSLIGHLRETEIETEGAAWQK